MNNQGIPAIRVENIIKEYPSGDEVIRVLKGVSFETQKGKLEMIAGPSGCGKTTLISIISGILNPTAGEVWIYNQCITQLTSDAKVKFRRDRIGFIFQQYHLLPALTAAENATIPLLARGVSLDEAKETAITILNRIGMSKSLNKLPTHLSGGEQQRVAIARALVHNPDIIICDEPTAALDAHTGQAVMEILREIVEKDHHTILIVTHDNRIFHFADRILHISDGMIESEELIQGR